MPIIFGSKLQSSVANATFLDKTTDDTTIGIITLNETLSGDSGSQISNLQREINKARKIVFAEQVKSAGGTITLNALSMNQEVRLSGTSNITMNSLPFTGVKVVEDGTEIILVGHDTSNTVTFLYGDVPFGLIINGDATLRDGSILTLIYNDEKQRYFEKSRNF